MGKQNIFRSRRRRDRAIHFAEQCRLWLGQLFNQAWVELCEIEQCDELGGCEYKRVLAEWRAAGIPADVWGFIQHRANLRSSIN